METSAPKPESFIRRWLLRLAKLAIVFLTVHLAFHAHLSGTDSDLPPDTGLVLVYGGGGGERIMAALKLAEDRKIPVFLASTTGTGEVEDAIARYGKKVKARVFIEGRAKTTDQNARYSAEVLERLPARKVVLVTSWWHMSRALLMTRLYLAGEGFSVYRCPSDSRPPNIWTSKLFWKEYAKTWGSLGRVLLAWLDHQWHAGSPWRSPR